MPKIKKIKLQETEYDLYDAKALHSGDSGTADITVSNATNAVNATNATTASKIGTSTVGGTTQPVYINNGVPTQLNYTIGKSVPSDAVFTDTVYTHPTTTATTASAVKVGKDALGHVVLGDSLTASDVGAVPTLTYEWNKQLACGSNGLVCLGKFPCYDTNITIDIDSTTSTTYHGTLVIATQNINTTGGGSLKATVYGDATGTLSSVIKIQYGSGSNVVSVYCNFPGWSKNLVHVRAVALTSSASDVLTSVTSIPTEAKITATNALTSMNAGTSIVVSASQPSGQRTGDFWYKTI